MGCRARLGDAAVSLREETWRMWWIDWGAGGAQSETIIHLGLLTSRDGDPADSLIRGIQRELHRIPDGILRRYYRHAYSRREREGCWEIVYRDTHSDTYITVWATQIGRGKI